MRIKVLAAAAIAALALGIYGMAVSMPWGRWFGAGKPMGPPLAPMPPIPSLTDEQREEISKLRLEFQKETAELRARLWTASLELREMLADPEASDEEILAKAGEVEDLRSQLREIALKHILNLRKVLKPEQIRGFGWGWMLGPMWGRRSRYPYPPLGPGRGRGPRFRGGPYRWMPCW